MLDWIARAVELSRRETFEVEHELATDFVLLFGLCMQGIRHASAYRTLCLAEMEHEAMAVARSSFEHAITAQWCYLTPDGSARLENETVHNRLKHYTLLARYLGNTELAKEVGAQRRPQGKGLPSFLGILQKLDHARFLQTTYAVLSLSTHVTHDAVLRYLVVNPDGTTGVRLSPSDARTAREHAAYATGISAMLCLGVLARLLSDDELEMELNEVSNELRLPIMLVDEPE